MNNNEFRCNCVEMTRAIKNKIDMEIANMSPIEVAEYLQNRRLAPAEGALQQFTILPT